MIVYTNQSERKVHVIGAVAGMMLFIDEAKLLMNQLLALAFGDTYRV